MRISLSALERGRGSLEELCKDLARNEEFSEIAAIQFFTVPKKNHSYLWGGGPAGENFEISHAIDM